MCHFFNYIVKVFFEEKRQEISDAEKCGGEMINLNTSNFIILQLGRS